MQTDFSGKEHPTRQLIEQTIERGNGIFRLAPAWIARTFMSTGWRLGLPEADYDQGSRGEICERWLGATNTADNPGGPTDEGLSYVVVDGQKLFTLKDAVQSAGPAIMGETYARTHNRLGYLAKIFDFGDRLPYHFHLMKEDAARVGRNPKEEAYYFPAGVDMGAHPETFFGVHPYIVEQQKYAVLLPHLIEWKDDRILQHARAYLLLPGEGFHLPSGVPHAPGSALTIELQEDSDVAAFMQAYVGKRLIRRELLYKDILAEDWVKYGERLILKMINWQISGDPYFYENRHLAPLPIPESAQSGGEEYWIYYNSTRFSGKKLVVKPGQQFTSLDKGAYNILVWKGCGRYDGHAVEAGNFNLEHCFDELFVIYARATTPLLVENTGTEDLELFKFFGPDVNLDIPMLSLYPAPETAPYSTRHPQREE